MSMGEAFLLTGVNREHRFLLMNFSALKSRVGVVSPAWFMSDLAEQFSNAWVATFGSKPQKLVCT